MRSMNDLLAYIDVPIEFKHKVQNYCDFKFNNKEGSQTLLQVREHHNQSCTSILERSLLSMDVS